MFQEIHNFQLEDIINKLVNLYKEYIKNKDNIHSCFYMEGVELININKNKVRIRFNYGT